MKIMMIPGERNEELILKVREATVAYHNDDRADFDYDEYRDVMDNLIDEYGLEKVFDALYYACENGAEMLQEQTDYFTERLYEDEIGYYFHRMTGIEGYYKTTNPPYFYAVGVSKTLLVLKPWFDSAAKPALCDSL